MNFARLENSERLQRTLSALETGEWKSTRDMIRDANICAVNSCIAELRANGIEIASRRIRCDDKPIWQYRLEGEA